MSVDPDNQKDPDNLRGPDSPTDSDHPTDPERPTDPDSPTATAALKAWTAVLDALEAALETALETASGTPVDAALRTTADAGPRTTADTDAGTALDAPGTAPDAPTDAALRTTGDGVVPSRTVTGGAATGDSAASTSAVGDLQRQTAVLAGWIPPDVEGPIPAVLLPRARSISERQRAALAQLTADADTLRRHRNALGTVQAATAPRQSAVYLDVTG